MSAPVLTVPQGGPIAARPRRESLYDTEAFTGAGSVTTFPFFQNTRSFAESAAGAKIAGLDTNLVGAGGSVPRGHYLRVFGCQGYVTRRGSASGAFDASAFGDKVRLWDMAFWRFLFGSTPYMDVPFNRIVSGTGLSGSLATGEALTVGDMQMGLPVCTCYYDLTVPGKIRKQTPQGVQEIRVPRIPIEFAETESFTANVSYPTRPSLAFGGTVFLQVRLVSVYLKPLAA
jgi:hypothetical protein